MTSSQPTLSSEGSCGVLFARRTFVVLGVEMRMHTVAGSEIGRFGSSRGVVRTLKKMGRISTRSNIKERVRHSFAAGDSTSADSESSEICAYQSGGCVKRQAIPTIAEDVLHFDNGTESSVVTETTRYSSCSRAWIESGALTGECRATSAIPNLQEYSSANCAEDWRCGTRGRGTQVVQQSNSWHGK